MNGAPSRFSAGFRTERRKHVVAVVDDDEIVSVQPWSTFARGKSFA